MTNNFSGGRQKRAVREAVLDAHGSRCWLCGRHIDRAMPSGTPWSWSMDHVIPYSQGGSNDPSNLRPAHERCNRDRGTEPVDNAA